MKPVMALVFHAPVGRTMAERIVEEARRASTRGLCVLLQTCGVDPIVVAPAEVARTGVFDVETRTPSVSADAPFHFGREIQRLIVDLDIENLLYFGSGSGGLLSETELRDLAEFARTERGAAVFNNFYSCDFAAFPEAQELLHIALPAVDNPLGFAVADAGIHCLSMPRSASTQFDIDTPSDVYELARTDRGNPELRRFLQDRTWDHPSLDPALAVLTDRSALTILVGRVNPTTWSHFEREVACRTSALVEGRGMRAATSRHVPWLRQTIAEDGAAPFFRRLENAADAAWIDTRPLLPFGESLPPPSTRFASDLFRLDEVDDPVWRSFTEAALQCRIPVVLGGHSLVSGGLYLAAEACWKARNVARRLHPDPFGGEKERP
ncbi:MAG: hypothetical protein PHX77_03900 [Candidatus Bipolaricaulis sp.]|nr:hypothetical protein [Candidatus Bipolaricaulis sp.]